MTSDECTTLIRELRSRRISGPADEYALRGEYVKVLEHARQSRLAYHLYDVWWILHQDPIRERATRGFYLDLWDEYLHQQEREPDNPIFASRQDQLLRAFVCLSSEQFAQILDPDQELISATAWKDQLRESIAPIINSNDPQSAVARRAIYSVTRLYASLYHKPVGTEGREALARQLEAAKAAFRCRVNDSGPVLNPLVDFSLSERVKEQDEFVRIFAYLYDSLDHFGTKNLGAYLATMTQDADQRLALERLLKYWASRSAFIEAWLSEKCEYTFRQPATSGASELPSYHGTDNYICVIGLRQVGKTHFLFASEAASRTIGDGPQLFVRHIDEGSEDAPRAPKPAKRSDGEEKRVAKKKASPEKDASQDVAGTSVEGRIEPLRAIWQQGEELTEEKAREGFATADQSIFAETAVRGLCRFTFNDIPGEDLWAERRPKPSDWLEKHFKTRKPCAVLLMFDRTDLDCTKYIPVIQIINQYQASENRQYRSIPIYIVFNKSDKLSDGRDDPGKSLRHELAEMLAARHELRDGFRFFSLRHEPGLMSHEDVVRVLQNTKTCCQSLPFVDLVSRDLTRVSPLIDYCLLNEFTNLSFFYTTCLARKDNDYGAVRALWDDITSFVGSNTVESRKTYYKAQFEDLLRADFGKVDELVRQGTITADMSLRDGDLQALATGKDEQIDGDFRSLLSATPENLLRDFATVLPSGSVYKRVAAELEKFTVTKHSLESELDRAVPALLRELGVPEASLIAGLEGYRDYEHEVKGLPVGVTSGTVRYFTSQPGFTQIVEKFKTDLLQAIEDFNKEYKERIQVTSDGVTMLTAQLPGVLWSIDAVEKREVAFDRRRGALNTLCPYRDRPITPVEESLLTKEGPSATVQKRILGLSDAEKVVLDKNAEQPNETIVDGVHTICELLKNYAPRYSQFTFERFDKDRFKEEALRRLYKERVELEDLLVEAVGTLLRIRHQLADLTLDTEAIRQRLQAKYLLAILRRQQFNVALFLVTPEVMVQTVNKAIEAIDRGTRSKRWIGLRVDAKARQAALTEANEALASVFLGNFALTFEDFSRRVPEILARLRVGRELFSEVRKNVPAAELAQIDSYKVKDFVLDRMLAYRNKLQEYAYKRKILLLKERANYLQSAKWLSGIEQQHKSFLAPALDARLYKTGEAMEEMNPEAILDVFGKGVEGLRHLDALWQPEPRGGGPAV